MLDLIHRLPTNDQLKGHVKVMCMIMRSVGVGYIPQWYHIYFVYYVVCICPASVYFGPATVLVVFFEGSSHSVQDFMISVL